LKYCGSLIEDPTPIHNIDYPLDDRRPIPRGPLGPTRLELDKPVIAAVAGPAVAGGFELALWCDVRVMEKVGLLRRVLPALGRASHRRRHGAAAAHRRHGARPGIILTGRKLPAENPCASAPASTSLRMASRASLPRRWRMKSRAFRKCACAPTGARLTCSRG